MSVSAQIARAPPFLHWVRSSIVAPSLFQSVIHSTFDDLKRGDGLKSLQPCLRLPKKEDILLIHSLLSAPTAKGAIGTFRLSISEQFQNSNSKESTRRAG